MENVTAPPAAVAPQAAAAPNDVSFATIYEKIPPTKSNPQPVISFGGTIPREPLVSIRPCDEFSKSYDLYIIAYLPVGAINVDFQSDISELTQMKTEAGIMNLRVITITYDLPGGMPVNPTYEQWQFFCEYTVVQTLAEAICVRYSINDPRTSRGTVTVVQLT